MTVLRKFLARSWADKLLLVRALALVAAVRLGLSVLPYRTVQRLLGPEHAGTSAAASQGTITREAQAYQRRVVAAVEAVGRRLLGDKPCLTQALVAQRLLRQGGYETSLRLGVTKDGHALLAHAWLERNGYVVIGGGMSQVRYATLTPVRPEAA